MSSGGLQGRFGEEEKEPIVVDLPQVKEVVSHVGPEEWVMSVLTAINVEARSIGPGDVE